MTAVALWWHGGGGPRKVAVFRLVSDCIHLEVIDEDFRHIAEADLREGVRTPGGLVTADQGEAFLHALLTLNYNLTYYSLEPGS